MIVNTPDDQDWRSIFSLLRKMEEPEVGGRADIPEELRSELERLARGEVAEADIPKICEKIVLFPAALKALARLLQEPGDSALDEKQP